jgi:hypothetical protein
VVYTAGKAMALLAINNYIKSNKADFDIIIIIPSLIIGRDERAIITNKLINRSSNSIILNILLGIKTDFPYVNNTIYI